MFLMPAILFGTLLATIPIVIHMLRRQKLVPIEWGAMQFLLDTPLKARRRRSIDNWLLLLIRMAILAMLAFALARPLWRGHSFVSSTPVDVVVVIDHSLSMGRRGAPNAGGNGTLFDEGVNAAQRLSTMLPASASMSIVLAEHTPKVITTLPIPMDAANKAADGAPRGEWQTVLQQLHQLAPGTTDANIPLALQSASELASRGRNARKLLLILSDQQRSNWAPGNDSAWKAAFSGLQNQASLPVYALPIHPAPAAPNLSVSSLALQPAFLGVHRPAQVTATVANTGASDLANIPVQLIVDGHVVATQKIASLAPSHADTVHFDQNFSDPGSHWVRVKADIIDGLEADNTATAAASVSPQLPILIVDGQLVPARAYPAAQFLTFAMQPVDAAVDPSTLVLPKTISVANIDSAHFNDYPIILLNDVPQLPRATVNRLTDYVRSGHGLWIILGPRTRESFLQNTLAKSLLLPATIHPASSTSQGVGIDVKDPEHPTVAVITAAQRNAFAGASIRTWWPITPRPDLHTILATAGSAGAPSDPLVTEMPLGQNGGRVILWTTAVSDLSWNNLPVTPNFVPLVNETLFYLAGSQAKSQNHDLDPGQTLLWSSPPLAAIPAIQSATLITPNGAEHTLQPELRGDHYLLTYKDTYGPGLYQLNVKAANGASAQPIYYTVNIDKAELDPATLSTADIDWLKSNHFLRDSLTPATLPKALNAQVGGTELWWLLATLVLLLLLTESVLTWRLARQQTSVHPEEAGLLKATAGGLR